MRRVDWEWDEGGVIEGGSMASREPGALDMEKSSVSTKDGGKKQSSDGSISEQSCPISQMFRWALPRFRKVNICSCDDSV